MKTAIKLIAEESERQVNQEGYSTKHDDMHDNGELAWAAASYSIPDNSDYEDHAWVNERQRLWPWDSESFKPTPDNRIRELVKAGALIVKEIERIQRKEGK